MLKETLRCGHKRFSAEEINLRLICVKHLSNSHPNTTALTKIMLDCFVQVCVDRFNRKDSFNFDRSLLIFFPFLYTEIINVRLVNRTVPAVGQWRFFIEVSGEQCVIMVGIWLMLQWCVESWTVENL